MLIHWGMLYLDKSKISDDDFLGNTLPDKSKISDDVDSLGDTLSNRVKSQMMIHWEYFT